MAFGIGYTLRIPSGWRNRWKCIHWRILLQICWRVFFLFKSLSGIFEKQFSTLAFLRIKKKHEFEASCLGASITLVFFSTLVWRLLKQSFRTCNYPLTLLLDTIITWSRSTGVSGPSSVSQYVSLQTHTKPAGNCRIWHGTAPFRCCRNPPMQSTSNSSRNDDKPTVPHSRLANIFRRTIFNSLCVYVIYN